MANLKNLLKNSITETLAQALGPNTSSNVSNETNDGIMLTNDLDTGLEEEVTTNDEIVFDETIMATGTFKEKLYEIMITLFRYYKVDEYYFLRYTEDNTYIVPEIEEDEAFIQTAEEEYLVNASRQALIYKTN